MFSQFTAIMFAVFLEHKTLMAQLCIFWWSWVVSITTDFPRPEIFQDRFQNIPARHFSRYRPPLTWDDDGPLKCGPMWLRMTYCAVRMRLFHRASQILTLVKKSTEETEDATSSSRPILSRARKSLRPRLTIVASSVSSAPHHMCVCLELSGISGKKWAPQKKTHNPSGQEEYYWSIGINRSLHPSCPREKTLIFNNTIRTALKTHFFLTEPLLLPTRTK